MNSGGGQDALALANTQPIGALRQPPLMYRPESMREMPLLTEEERKKYEHGLIMLWKAYDSSAPDSKEKADVEKKIQNFGNILNNKIASRKQAFSQRQAQQGQQREQQGVPGAQGAQRIQIQAQQSIGQQGLGQQPPAQRPISQQPQSQSSQGAQNTQRSQTAHVGPPQPVLTGAGGAGAGIGAPATPTMQGMPSKNMAPVAPKLPAHYVRLIQELNVPAPANVVDKAKWLSDLKARFGQALMQVEIARAGISKIDQQVKEREEKGVPLTDEEKKALKERKDHHIKQHNNAKAWVDQLVSKSQPKTPQTAAPSPANVAGAVGNQVNQPRPQQQAPNSITSTAPAAKVQVPSAAGLPNNPMQNPTAAVNAAFEVAKNQQIAATRVQGVNGGGAIQAGLQGTQTVHPPQAPPAAPPTASLQAQPAPISQNPLSQPAAAHQQQPAIKIEPGTQSRPVPTPINPAIATNVSGIPSAGTPTQNSALRIQTPQSAHTPTGAGPPAGPPRAYSHADAVFAASQNRTGSTGGPISSGTPASTQGVMGTVPQQPQGHPHAHPTQQSTPASVVPSKLPIPKTLPERAMQPPTPVGPTGGIGNGRPTYSGGSGIAGGVMSQPALAKTPGYTLEGEGERVLNKKKLDELVRQVCGGTAEGQEGNLLAPEVEESVLNLADAFMDSVIHQACRNAKERGSKVLEIRDIQLVLERTYNIRIPGYSSEELRTVRKVQPNAQWITKMSAVQAAKVMPGKGDL